LGEFVLRDSTLTDNYSANGGAIHNEGSMAVLRSTISGNRGSRGGGIYNIGELVVDKSTITDNVAGVSGGGIYTCCGGTTTLRRSSVTGNAPDNIVSAP
jgi:predicted outer membrane repeat protein